MYANKQSVALDTLLLNITYEEIQISKASLERCLAEMDFQYKRTDDKKSLCETNNVVSQKWTFIREYMKNLNFPWQFVFIDGTWIFNKGTGNNTWEDGSELFEGWSEDKVLNRLEEPSILLLDNASYNSPKKNKDPVSSWKKDICKWNIII